MAVVATAGTTLTGAVDPIDALADLCAEQDVWLHIDGAYGLPAARVPSAAHLFRGLDRADSVTIDAHKWLYLPKACGIVLVRSQQDLHRALGHEGEYLPHDRQELHAADITLEYSRPFRALKLWLALRVHGAEAFRAAIGRNLRPGAAALRRGRREPGARAARVRAAALGRAVPPCPRGHHRPRRPQRGDRPAAAGGRRVLGRPRPDRRADLHPSLHRQLPHRRRRRARLRRGGRAHRSRGRRNDRERDRSAELAPRRPGRRGSRRHAPEGRGRGPRGLPRTRRRRLARVRRHLHAPGLLARRRRPRRRRRRLPVPRLRVRRQDRRRALAARARALPVYESRVVDGELEVRLTPTGAARRPPWSAGRSRRRSGPPSRARRSKASRSTKSTSPTSTGGSRGSRTTGSRFSAAMRRSTGRTSGRAAASGRSRATRTSSPPRRTTRRTRRRPGVLRCRI